eukprot:5653939-Amphidinium_carterae.2
MRRSCHRCSSAARTLMQLANVAPDNHDSLSTVFAPLFEPKRLHKFASQPKPQITQDGCAQD